MTEREQSIRERAYQIWLDAGKPDGRATEFWQESEAQIAKEEEQTELDSRRGNPLPKKPI